MDAHYTCFIYDSLYHVRKGTIEWNSVVNGVCQVLSFSIYPVYVQ